MLCSLVTILQAEQPAELEMAIQRTLEILGFVSIKGTAAPLTPGSLYILPYRLPEP